MFDNWDWSDLLSNNYVNDALAGLLVGAAVGALSSVITGGNVLKGALVGGGVGAAGGLIYAGTNQVTDDRQQKWYDEDVKKGLSGGFSNNLDSELSIGGQNVKIGSMGGGLADQVNNINNPDKGQSGVQWGKLAGPALTLTGSALAGAMESKAMKEAARIKAQSDMAILDKQKENRKITPIKTSGPIRATVGMPGQARPTDPKSVANPMRPTAPTSGWRLNIA